MTLLGLDMLEWLRRKDGVSCVRDATTEDGGEAIRCHAHGQEWLITLDHCNPDKTLFDPRETRER